MEITAWLSLATICILGAMSPGPSLAVILKHSVSSIWHGLIAAISHGAAVALYAVATIVGLSALVIKFPLLYKVLVYGGAAYLLWMGYKALTAKPAPQADNIENQDNATQQPQASQTTIAQAIKDSAAIAILNPKLAIFFTALFSQFITPETSNIATSSIMVATVGIIDALWYCIVACAVALASSRIAFNKHATTIDKISGIVFIGLAVRVVTL
ncbi:LysE family translocator [Flocculibacter collagenilyticus]|uniref:LysE family translocator n=1 Tax=Flocculibacter collagenilyticus TaxID=2744479 RepID=UPI0018F28C08|nr:LysE family translocator [Flocculibacter collagenilyticus]